MIKRNKGFTLMEMLVTVAIIGVLATVILTEVEPVKNKAKDTRIIQEINQIRSIAESMYDGDYSDLEELPRPSISNKEMKNLVEDIESLGGEVYLHKSNNDNDYSVYTKLNEAKGEEPNLETQYYCTDSAGHSVISTKRPEFPEEHICPEEGEELEDTSL